MVLPIAQTSGYSNALLNAATLNNSGVEIMLRATPIKSASGFRWDLSFNYAKNKNEVVNINDGPAAFIVAQARWAGATITGDVGKPFGTIKGNDFTYNEKGEMKLTASGTPLFTSSPVDLGNTLPDWTGGMTNSFSFKGIELKAVIDIRVGGDLYSMTNRALYDNGVHPATLTGRESWNEYGREVRAWEVAGSVGTRPGANNRGYVAPGVNPTNGANTVGVDPAVYWGEVAGNTPRPFIYDGGYVKLRDVGLNYTLPKSLYKRLPVQNITVGFIGRNLWIISKNVPNIDPESNYNNGNGQGFEYGSLPGRKRYGFNVLIKL